MTDRFNSLTVALNRDIRDDDAEEIIKAIQMIKGVAAVTGNVVDSDTYVAEVRERQRWTDKILQILKDD